MVGAITFLAELGDLSRFESPRQLMGYLGLTPSERSTGKKSDQELSDNAKALEDAVQALTHSDLGSSSEVALTRPEPRHSPSNTHKSRDESRG
jgi:hypothetical protein